MSIPQEPDSPEPPRLQPTRELLLAQALDACIRAERRVPGSARDIIANQPAWSRGELNRLVNLAGSLEAAATNAVISDDFRVAARARLMERIGGDLGVPVSLPGPRLSAVPSANGYHPMARRRSMWWWRGTAGLLAAVLGVAATLTASASALPGEPLYGVKQAQEEFGVRLAADDQARALALLRRADARLDETSRLLQQGRTDAALETTQRYDQVVERATTTFVVTIDDALGDPPAAAHIETKLSQQQDLLKAMLQFAPEPARADLREALVATERSRALVADPRPVEQALGRDAARRSAFAAAVPTVSAEDLSTPVPVRRVVAVQPEPTAAPPAVVADATDVPEVAVVLGRSEDSVRGEDSQSGRGGEAQSVRGGEGQSVGDGRGPTTNAVVAIAGHSSQSTDRSGQSTEKSVIQKDEDNAAPAAMVARDLKDSDSGENGGPIVALAPSVNGNGDDRAAQASNRGTDTRTVVVQKPAAPATAISGSNSGDGHATANIGGSSNGGGKATLAESDRPAAPARTTSAQAVTAAERANADTALGERSGGDARPASPSTQGAAVRPQPTPTPAARRSGSDSSDKPPTASPTRPPTDPRANGGGDDHH